MSFVCVSAVLVPVLVRAQGASLQQQENQVIREFVLPEAPAQPPVYTPQPYTEPDYQPDYQPEPDYQPPAGSTADRSTPAAPPPRSTASNRRSAPTSGPQSASNLQYILDFTRSPAVGNRLRLQGVFPETRLGFNRPKSWKLKAVTAVVRFQHSPTLLADRSVLMVRVNDTSVGSVKLDRPDAKIGQASFSIPVKLLQDYNEISFLAQQQTSETCTNPNDPTLWSEILPDSKILFDFQPQPIALSFKDYPYPFIDAFDLNPSQIAYLRPKTFNPDWLTAVSRFQISAARLADFRPLDTRLLTSIEQAKKNEGLLIIGTPADQPDLTNLSLPFALRDGRWLDGAQNPLPDDVGVLMLTTTKNKDVPVLVASGNAPAGVLKAVQFLVQSPDRRLGTGQALTVSSVTDVPSPDPRAWSGYLPVKNEFQLTDLTLQNRQPFQDVTVHGTNSPVVEIPFRALPDDRLLQGSTMTLHYSHSPQINSRNSAIEVMLDGVTIGSKRLVGNGNRETFNVNLPPDLIKPDSVLGIHFILYSEQPGVCGLEADQQLWGTVHSETTFKLKRDNVVQLPDLELLKAGFPLAAPQDLSTTAITLPDNPTESEVKTLLAFSERMGRISRSESVKLTVYRANELPETARSQQNIVGIGTRDRFPFPQALEPPQGLALASSFLRQWQQSQIQPLPDKDGIVKAVPSPWSDNRVLLALTSQTDEGLQEVQELFHRDPLFSQLRGDTVLINRTQSTPSPYDSSGYTLEFLQQVQPRQIAKTTLLRRIVLFLQDNWWVLLLATVLLALLLFSFSQLFINRVA